jgi:transposase-like protein
MAKFTADDKLQAVKRFLNGNESSHEIGKSIGTDNKAVLKWVKQYEYNGLEAFVKPYTDYTLQFKIDVLNYMVEYGKSLNETAAIFNIAAPSTILVWKRKFETDTLQSKKKGRLSMENGTKKQTKATLIEGSVEALEARIKQLEMENEYLKKLNALVQSKDKSPSKTKRK